MTKKTKPTQKQGKTTPEKEVVFTKDDFMKALKKATRPILPKVSPVKGKKETSA
jgi:hypothetical protein